MALPEPRIMSFEELRFRPANSNERARAGLQHAFSEVPACSFARDDGISHYMAAASGIDGFPAAHLNQPALHDDVPEVGHETGGIVGAAAGRLARGGFGLSVLLHAAVAVAIGYFATLSLPDTALLAGETVVSLELLSDSEVDAQSAGEDEQVDAAQEKPVEKEVAEEPEVEVADKPIEEARLTEPIEKPVEPVVTAEEPEVLATDQPSSFAVEQAARTILDTTEIEPIPLLAPKELVVPVVVEKPEARLAQSLPHPISKPRKIEKVADVRPIEKKPEPKVTEKTPERKKPVDRSKKVRGNQGADESDSNKGTTNPKSKGKKNQDASDGGRQNREIGNASTTNYKGLVQRKLERAKKRVRVAGKGSVTVSFTITANGSVTGLRVRKSSGKPAVDKGALDVVRKASPFPAIPPEAKRGSWSMSVPMTFK